MSRSKEILRLRGDLLRRGLTMEAVARELGGKGVSVRAVVRRYWTRPKSEWPKEGTFFRRTLDRLAEITGKKGAKGMMDVTAEKMRKEEKGE